MRCYISVVCALSVLVAVSYAAPATLDQLQTQDISINGQDQQLSAMLDQRLRRDLSFLSVIDFNRVAKLIEQIDIPTLRKMFPTVFRILDNVIQNVTSQAFSIIGRAVLQSGGLGGGGGGGGGESRVSVVLPSFDDDEDDDDDDSESTTSSQASLQLASRLSDSDVRVLDIETSVVSSAAITSNDEPSSTSASVNLDATSTSSDATSANSDLTSSTTTTAASLAAGLSTELSSTTNEATFTTKEVTPNAALNLTFALNATSTAAPLSTSEASLNNEINSGDTSSNPLNLFTSPETDTERKVRTIRATDQDVAASGGNAPLPNEDLSNVEDDADRDKRYLPFGLSASGDHGTTGGSGNFLFDIIRRTADGAARAAGTVYRMVAGTDTLGFGLTASSTATKTLAPTATSQLVAGSGASEATDEKDGGVAGVGAGGVAEIDVAAKGDGYTEGIPGPITRLFVLANRGLANLVQDLILRLAQTSERIVNFKARLVTSLI